MGCHSLLQGIFLTQGSNLGLLHCRQILYHLASLVAQIVNHLPTMWETWVHSLSREDPLEEGMATHSSVLAWRIPWTEEPGGLWSVGSHRVGRN